MLITLYLLIYYIQCLFYSDPLFLNLRLFITIADLVLFISEFMFDISTLSFFISDLMFVALNHMICHVIFFSFLVDLMIDIS